MRYAGELALVVGASGGIGQALARDLIGDGCDAALTYQHHRAPVDALVELGQGLGRRCLACQLDVRDASQVDAVCQQVLDELGAPSIVAYCAGVLRDRPLIEMATEDWTEVLETNLSGVFHFLRRIVPSMMRKQRGRILTVASVSGLAGQAGQANYAASKGGMIAMTRALARELGPFNITVNSIAPGIVETEMTEPLSPTLKRHYLQRIPLRRFARPEDILPAARLLLAPEAGYITGQVLVVDGGLSC